MKKLLQIALATMLVILGTFTTSINIAHAQSASPKNVLLPLEEISPVSYTHLTLPTT
jgi:hypothetical protein